MKGKGHVILIIGMRGEGKSTMAKKLIRKSGKIPLIYDVQHEHENGIPAETITIKEFIQKASEAMDSVIVFEEATIFFNNKGGGSDENMRRILIGSRHRRNTIILLFHSIRSVPAEIMDFISYYILFKTADRLSLIRKKYEESQLLDDFLLLQDAKPKSHIFICRRSM